MKKPRKKFLSCEEETESDETFQYIAGYTEGGAAFGITWEDARLIEEGGKVQRKEVEIKNSKNPIDLNELIDAFDIGSDSLRFFVNQTSGKIVSLMSDEIELEEDGESEAILESNDYIEIPSRWDLNKYDIMADFVASVEDAQIQDSLARVIQGKGAFRRFYDAVKDYRIEGHWYQYQHKRLKEKAIEWCRDNDLIYTDSSSVYPIHTCTESLNKQGNRLRE